MFKLLNIIANSTFLLASTLQWLLIHNNDFVVIITDIKLIQDKWNTNIILYNK